MGQLQVKHHVYKDAVLSAENYGERKLVSIHGLKLAPANLRRLLSLFCLRENYSLKYQQSICLVSDFAMGLYADLPGDIEEVDVIIAGGEKHSV
jgi:hypothetical protein